MEEAQKREKKDLKDIGYQRSKSDWLLRRTKNESLTKEEIKRKRIVMKEDYYNNRENRKKNYIKNRGLENTINKLVDYCKLCEIQLDEIIERLTKIYYI